MQGKANIVDLVKFIHEIVKDKTNILRGNVVDEFGCFDHLAKSIATNTIPSNNTL